MRRKSLITIPEIIAIDKTNEKLDNNLTILNIKFKYYAGIKTMIKNFDMLVKGEYSNERRIALEIFEGVLNKINGYNAVKEHVKIFDDYLIINNKKIDLSSYKKIFLIGFGKASAEMAKAMEEFMIYDDGAIITTHDTKLKTIKVFKGSHPLPSEKNIEATKEIVNIVKKAGKNDLIFVLISGGGSSLFCMPMISLNSMINVTDELIKAGCNIEELNTVRKHLSYIKGGKLAKLTEAKIIGLIISDIIGNPVEFIASAPTAGDKTTFGDAYKIMKKYRVKNKEAMDLILKGMKGEIEETPDKLKNVENFIIADINIACREAKKIAEFKGYYSKILTTSLRGEAKEIGIALARYAKFYPRNHSVLIAGGETTVKVKGNGMGGRNQEMVLSAIKEINGLPMAFLSCGTDGIDGSSPAAGAIADGNSMKMAIKLNLNLDDFLSDNNSYEFFKVMDDAIITGYTGTNVMDIQIIVKR